MIFFSMFDMVNLLLKKIKRLILFSWFGVLWLLAGVWWQLGEESLISGLLEFHLLCVPGQIQVWGTQGDLCVLLRLNPGVRRVHLLIQLSWIASRLLDTCVYSIYLVDRLILICPVPLSLSHSVASGGSFDVFQGQNYVVLLPGNEMSAGFHYRNLILGI